MSSSSPISESSFFIDLQPSSSFDFFIADFFNTLDFGFFFSAFSSFSLSSSHISFFSAFIPGFVKDLSYLIIDFSKSLIYTISNPSFLNSMIIYS